MDNEFNQQPIQEPTQTYSQPSAPVEPAKPDIPEEYKPISMWGYFGYEILFSIPFIGFIFLLVFAFGGSNVNVKNFARSYFCYIIIIAIIIAISLVLFGGVAFFEGFTRR